jgi:nickel/cobalt exporter
MSLSRTTEARVSVALVLVAAAASIWLSAGHFDAALAQATNPFGGPRAPAAPPPSDGVIGWMFAKQAEFYRNMSATIRTAKTDGSAVWTLLGISFLYGIFHAAGPGHGKAVISSYVVANNETWRRGVVLSFASALLQAFVAVAIVGIARVVLNATAGQLCNAERVIEIVSYGLIALVGARLIWVKGRGFVNAARGLGRPLHAVGAAVTPPHDHKHHDHKHHDHGQDHNHAHHDHAHDDGHHHDHGHLGDGHHHHHGDEHASAWGHGHGPEPEELAGPGGWQRGLSAIVAVGLRPCSGAIIVLVFALAQGLFWAGVAATFVMGLGTAITVAAIATLAVGFRSAAAQFAGTRSGYGMLALRGIEVGAAVIVLAFGVLLLFGYLAAERGPCF